MTKRTKKSPPAARKREAWKNAVLERLETLEDEVRWMQFKALPPMQKLSVMRAVLVDDAQNGELRDFTEANERMIEMLAESGDPEHYLASERMIVVRDKMAAGTPPLRALREALAMFPNKEPWTREQRELAETALKMLVQIYDLKEKQ